MSSPLEPGTPGIHTLQRKPRTIRVTWFDRETDVPKGLHYIAERDEYWYRSADGRSHFSVPFGSWIYLDDHDSYAGSSRWLDDYELV